MRPNMRVWWEVTPKHHLDGPPNDLSRFNSPDVVSRWVRFGVILGHFGSILDLGPSFWTLKGVQDPPQPVDWGPFGGRLSRDVWFWCDFGVIWCDLEWFGTLRDSDFGVICRFWGFFGGVLGVVSMGRGIIGGGVPSFGGSKWDLRRSHLSSPYNTREIF